MNNSPSEPIVIEAPAKLNLGLEVVGRRHDGYHELVTIFLAVSLFDRLTMRRADHLEVTSSDAELAGAKNLVLRALKTLRTATATTAGAVVDLHKGIPVAAGLGGASGDAAAALLGVRELWQLCLGDEAEAAIGRQIGSDVPFFLLGGCAIGRGVGERLEPLPLPHNAWFVIVAPTISIPRKTATLYARLTEADFSDGSRVEAQAKRMHAGLAIDPDLLGNAFSRALYDFVPWLASLPRVMRQAGAPAVALSGAGPAHYAMFSDPEMADQVARALAVRLGNAARVFVVAPVPAHHRRSLGKMEPDAGPEGG